MNTSDNDPRTRVEIFFFIARICTAVFAFVAVGNHPYSFYIVFRWVTCLTMCFGFYLSFKKSEPFLPYLFGIVAVLFNPIVPIHLARAQWRIVDLVLGVTLAISVLIDCSKKFGKQA